MMADALASQLHYTFVDVECKRKAAKSVKKNQKDHCKSLKHEVDDLLHKATKDYSEFINVKVYLDQWSITEQVRV